jgi:hypothetical protein
MDGSDLGSMLLNSIFMDSSVHLISTLVMCGRTYARCGRARDVRRAAERAGQELHGLASSG